MSFDLGSIGIQKNIPKVGFTDYCGLISASPKWGKTTMASLFPKAVIVPFERGYDATVSNVLKDMDGWDGFIDFIDKLEDNRLEIGDDLVTIVFDTVNEAYKLCEPYTLRRLSRIDGKKYSAAGDVPHGKFYSERDKDFEIQVKRLLNLGFMPLFISHSEEKTIKPKDEPEYQVRSSTMPDRLEKIIYPLVSYLMFGETRFVDDGNGNKVAKRALVTKSNEMTTAGSRVRLEEDIIFDTEEELIEKFQAAFKVSIQETLDKAGIKTNIDKLEKQQADEKKKEVEKYVEKLETDLPTLITKIKDTMKSKMAKGMTAPEVMAILAKFEIVNPDVITDIELAKKVLAAFK